MTTTEFKAFSKIPRLYSQCRIAEKIDGTNACIVVSPEGVVSAQSRTRVITPEADNYGFARWVAQNAVELAQLGPGYHFGEWWGVGIQRHYDLAEKRFSAFWRAESAPACVGQVPVMYKGEFHMQAVHDCIGRLAGGSLAAPGFMRPEGIVVTFAAGPSFKVIMNGDESKRAG